MRGVLVALIITTLGAAASSALAQGNDADHEEARMRFERAMELVRQERWEAALSEFDESLHLSPTRTALFNRALCLGLLGRPADGVRALEEYVERFGEPGDPAEREEVGRELARLRERAGRIDLRISGASSGTVLLDGEEAGTLPLPQGPLMVNPGRHHLVIRGDAFEEQSQWVTVDAGSLVRLVIALTPAAPPPEEPSPQPAPEIENTQERCRDGEDNDRDGLADCLDQQCFAFVFCAGQPPTGGATPLSDGTPANASEIEPGPDPGWSLAAGIVGVLMAGAVTSLGVVSDQLADDQGTTSLGLGITAWTLLTVMGPVVDAGARSARQGGVRGCLGCRITGWILYGLGVLGSMTTAVVPLVMRESEGPPFGLITAASVVGAAGLIFSSIDAFVANTRARRLLRAEPEPIGSADDTLNAPE